MITYCPINIASSIIVINMDFCMFCFQCDASKSPRILFDHIFNEPKKIILLGPPCSSGAMVVSSASVYWNLITVLYY